MRFSIAHIIFCALLFLPPGTSGAEGTFILQGIVTTLSGDPLPDAEVYLYSTSNTRRPADFISPKTGKNGLYRMILPKAAYWGVARIKKGERFGPLMPGDKHSGEPVKIDPDTEASLTLNFTVADMQELAQRREKGREELMEISGTVSFNGKGVAGAYVYARTGRITATLPEYFSGWTDATGEYRLKLPPGSYLLGCDRIFPPSENSNNHREIEITTGKLPVAINLQLPVE